MDTRTPPEVTPGLAFDDKATLDRLPVGVVVVDRGLDLVYANLAARRVVHPATLRVGGRIPALGDPSLDEVAARALERGIAVAVELSLGDGRVAVVEGCRSGRYGEVTLVLHDVS